MDSFLGQTAEIKAIRQNGVIKIDIDDNRYGWAPEWLVPEKSA
jgi:hypothetical protein